MINTKIAESKGFHNCVYYSGKDITEEMLDECFNLDNNFFQEKYLYNKQKVKAWLLEYNDMCGILYDTKSEKVIAYCFYLFISDEALELFKSNKISYFTLGKSLLAQPKNNDKLNLFCLSDACEEHWSLVKIHKLLNECFVFNLYKLAETQDIMVKNICIDVVCEYDNILVNQFKIENKVQTMHNSIFHYGEFDPRKVWNYCYYSDYLINEYNRIALNKKNSN